MFLLTRVVFSRVGSPRELYEAKGQFYDMMRHSGEFEDLEKLITGT